MPFWQRAAIAFIIAGIINSCALLAPTKAEEPKASAQLQTCLKRADDLPDIAAAEAIAWEKKGGGRAAHLCRAFAQANRGMHEDSAREFWALAIYYDRHDAARAVSLHDLSGQEFMRAKDPKNAEAQYATAFKIAPDNVANLIALAQCLMEMERYWGALEDLNHALKVDPNSIEALRQRGRVWTQLGNAKNAQEDFEHAEALSGVSPASEPAK